MVRLTAALWCFVSLAVLVRTTSSSYVGADAFGAGGKSLDSGIVNRQRLAAAEDRCAPTALESCPSLRLAGGGKHGIELAFAGSLPKTLAAAREARHAGPSMRKDDQGKKFVIFQGRFGARTMPKLAHFGIEGCVLEPASFSASSHEARQTLSWRTICHGTPLRKNILSSLFGISLFSGTIKPSFAHSGQRFPLLMADADSGVPPHKDGRKRVLILLSDTGGGHKASAKAIQAALDELYPGKFYVEITDIWTDYGKWPFTTAVESYQWMAKHMWAWRMFYYYGEFPPTQVLTEKTASMLCYNNFKAYIESFQPDIVVSVHPLCQSIPLQVLKNMGGGKRQIPFVTVVTDLGGAHTLWFHKEVDRCCVPGDAVEKLALKCGLTRDQVRKHGLPVRQGFWDAAGRKADSKKLKVQLKLEEVPTVLVVGGGDGVGGLQKVAQNVGIKLGQYQGRCQMVVVCGKNEVVQKALKSAAWPPNVNVVVQGFVSNMDDWMVASDCLVTKAGPGTIAEASIVGLPTMLSSFLPGQEAGNVPYVIESGFGDYEADAAKLAQKVSSWLSDDKKLSTMSEAASMVGKHHSSATKDIARDIADLCFSKSPLSA